MRRIVLRRRGLTLVDRADTFENLKLGWSIRHIVREPAFARPFGHGRPAACDDVERRQRSAPGPLESRAAVTAPSAKRWRPARRLRDGRHRPASLDQVRSRRRTSLDTYRTLVAARTSMRRGSCCLAVATLCRSARAVAAAAELLRAARSRVLADAERAKCVRTRAFAPRLCSGIPRRARGRRRPRRTRYPSCRPPGAATTKLRPRVPPGMRVRPSPRGRTAPRRQLLHDAAADCRVLSGLPRRRAPLAQAGPRLLRPRWKRGLPSCSRLAARAGAANTTLAARRRPAAPRRARAARVLRRSALACSLDVCWHVDGGSGSAEMHTMNAEVEARSTERADVARRRRFACALDGLGLAGRPAASASSPAGRRRDECVLSVLSSKSAGSGARRASCCANVPLRRRDGRGRTTATFMSSFASMLTTGPSARGVACDAVLVSS